MSKPKSAFNLQTCARANILALQPYTCARDEYPNDGSKLLLDANENALGPSLDLSKLLHKSIAAGLHRYPDPDQKLVKQLLCQHILSQTRPTVGNVTLSPANVCLGNGSDEILDLLVHCFCIPGQDAIAVCSPTYGEYTVVAQIHGVDVIEIPLDVEHSESEFELQPDLLCDVLSRKSDKRIKMVFLCSPGNPTGKLLRRSHIEQILYHPTWNGVVVVDEAYIEFATAKPNEGYSLAADVTCHQNLVVVQTLSKAFGLAGLRLGAAFASPEITTLLNNIKAPYNISSMTAHIAAMALQPENIESMKEHVQELNRQRTRLRRELLEIPGIHRCPGGLDANFVLFQLRDKPEPDGTPSNIIAQEVYRRLAVEQNIVVRYQGNKLGCTGCLRVSVGSTEEVDEFLDAVRNILGDIY